MHEAADVQCDLKTLTFPANHANVAVAIHVIEHFYEWEVVDVLKEWHRVLQEGGKLILELPSMNKVLNYIRDRMNEGTGLSSGLSWYAFWGDPRHKSIPMCHKWGYTEEMIEEKLRLAGFKDIRFEEPHYHFEIRDMRVVAFK